jgi:hypothetical protein
MIAAVRGATGNLDDLPTSLPPARRLLRPAKARRELGLGACPRTGTITRSVRWFRDNRVV